MKNGETFHYKGERSREVLVDYAERMALPPIQVIDDPTIMKDKIKSGQSFFLYVGDNTGAIWVRQYQRVTNESNILKFILFISGCIQRDGI